MLYRKYHVSLFNILKQSLTLFTQLKKQERFVAHELPIVIQNIQKGLAGKLDTKHYPRIIKYWQLGLNTICNNFYTLTDSVLSPQENQRLLLLSIFSPLYDDLFDAETPYPDRIESFRCIEELTPQNFTEEFIKLIYLELLKDVPDPNRFRERLLQVFKWEKASLKQRDLSITKNELYEITYQKSYHSILLYLSVLDSYPDDNLMELLYPMAGLLQLTNDAFDVYKDRKAGVYTVPNLFINYQEIKIGFLNEVANFNQKLSELSYKIEYKKKYAITTHSVSAMGWMALNQLQEVLKNVNNPADIDAIARKQLICDMDTLSQKIKWLKHIQHLSNYSG